MKITSVNNEIIKNTSKLLLRKYRDKDCLFLIEGEKGVQEAFNSGIELLKIFVLNKDKYVFNNVEIIETTEAVMRKISDAKTVPPIVAVAKQQPVDITAFQKMKHIILLDGLKDAGNLGTIIRSAVAFNIDGIILFGDTVDLYNPKTVRATVGNLWKLPVIYIKNIDILLEKFSDYTKIATLPKSSNSFMLKQYKPQDKYILMLGSENTGLSSSLKEIATQNLTIEMSDKVESLNLSVATSVIMYMLNDFNS